MNPIQITQSDFNLLQGLLSKETGGSAEEKASRELLAGELLRAQIVEEAEISSDVITLRSKARLLDLDDGDILEFTLTTPEEADVSEGRISIFAPLGTAMLGFRVGDTFEWTMPGGVMKLKVEKVTRD